MTTEIRQRMADKFGRNRQALVVKPENRAEEDLLRSLFCSFRAGGGSDDGPNGPEPDQSAIWALSHCGVAVRMRRESLEFVVDR